MSFTEEQRQKTRSAWLEYNQEKDRMYDRMHRMLEFELGMDPESVGRLLEEEK